MSLYQVAPGGVVNAADVNQLVQFVTGLDANDGLRMAMTGAVAANRYIGANTQGPPTSGTWGLGDWAMDQGGTQWVCTAAGTPGTWTGDLGVIKETVLGSPAATVTFSAIPQNFKHLMLIVRAKSASTATNSFSDNLVVGYNGISTAHYNFTVASGNNSSTVGANYGSGATGTVLTALWTSFAPNTAGAGVSLNILPNYTDANFSKLIMSLGYVADGGATVAAIEMAGGAFAATTSTAAITSLTISTNSAANFTANSSFCLYGMP